MVDRKLCAFGLFLFVFLWCNDTAYSGYLITTPRVYRTGTVQRLNVHLHGDNEPWNITASLIVSRTTYVIAKETKTFNGNSLGSMEIHTPQDRSLLRYSRFDDIYLHVHGVAHGKPDFKYEQSLTLGYPENTLFIQTDKPIYKPGQTIRMRIVGIKPDLKPLNGKVDTIFISNPKRVRMMQWDDIYFQNGIASVEMPLSKHPVLGEWKILARYQYKIVEKTITIAKYVLPKFEVIIEPPPFIAVDSKVVTGTICARYTDGRFVSGNLRVMFELKGGRRKFTINKKIKGCYHYYFTNRELGLANLQSSHGKVVLNIMASVNEEATNGVTQSAISTESKIAPYRVKLNFNIGTPTSFKPGLPFFGQLHVTTPDGEPITNENITIEAQDDKWKTFFTKSFLVTNGVINFEVHGIPHTEKLYLKATHSGTIPGWNSQAEFQSSGWYSKSSSFLSLQKVPTPIKVGKTAKINFVFTLKDNENITTFVYQLVCGGNIIVSERRRLPVRLIKPTEAEGSIVFPVTQAMVPSCRLLVYYFRKDGETVADSMVIDVEDKLENQVVVRFSDNVHKPGEPVQITLTATPGSTVALAGVDKSVRLLKAADDLNSDKVMNILSSYDVGPTELYGREKKCGPDNAVGYVDSSKAFYDAGLIYLSDFDIDSRYCSPISPIYVPNKPYAPLCKASRRFHPALRPPIQIKPRQPARPRQKRSTPPIKNSPSITVPQVSLKVPETWLWTEETISNTTGKKTITVTVPDTITSWYATAFAMSSSTGMRVADPSTLKVFQPFFVSFTLPYSVIRGEQVSVVVTVFNYMSRCSTVRIRLITTDHFHLSSPNDVDLRLRCICGNETKSVKYVITPVQLGHIPLKVTVQNVVPSLCGDPSEEAPLGLSEGATGMLLVEPEGVRQEYTYSDFICPNGTFNDEINLKLPKDVVPDSVHATVSAIGDVMGPSLAGLEGLLDLPVGCGEQNMVNFAPNIFVMQYLNSTNQTTDEIYTKAVGFLRTGYERELKYKRKDGSYSANGDSDAEGSLWLTAFVLRSFTRARQFIFVDEKEISSITRWIISKQQRYWTGCFPKHGQVFHKGLKGGVSTTATFTAYVVISLLESKKNRYSTVDNALACISAQNDNMTDSYSNAIIAYALTLARHQDQGKYLQRLKSQAIVKDGQMHWEKKEKPMKRETGEWVPPYHRSSSSNIEMTSYALMAMIGDGTDSTALAKARPIVRWLSKQRNAHGGFASTQDTTVALQALSKYAVYVYRAGTLKSTRIDIGHADKGNFSHNFRINDNNSLVLQQVEVPANSLPMKIPIKAVGDGCALVQAHVSYNIPAIKEKHAFKLSTYVRRRKVKRAIVLKTNAGERLCQPLEMTVCAQWLKEGKSNMPIIEVKLVSGFNPDEESLERLLNHSGLGLMRFEIEKNKVVLYFNEMKTMCLSFGIHQTVVVKKTKPASVTVYEYYDTDKAATTNYAITEDLCISKPANRANRHRHCPFCPRKVDLNTKWPLVCQINNVLSFRTLRNGSRKFKVLLTRQELISKTPKRTVNRRIEVSVPRGCQCDTLRLDNYAVVLLKDRKIGNRNNLIRVRLDQDDLVLPRRTVSAKSLRTAFSKCFPSNVKVYSGL